MVVHNFAQNPASAKSSHNQAGEMKSHTCQTIPHEREPWVLGAGQSMPQGGGMGAVTLDKPYHMGVDRGRPGATHI